MTPAKPCMGRELEYNVPTAMENVQAYGDDDDGPHKTSSGAVQ